MVKILLVEDDIQVRELIKETLSFDNFTFLETSKGKEALQLFVKEQPSILIVDINLADSCSGLEVVKKIREQTDKVKIAILTGAIGEEEKDICYQAGADAYLPKPFSPLSLIQTVEEFLNELEEENG